jgi:hypothetical protein
MLITITFGGCTTKNPIKDVNDLPDLIVRSPGLVFRGRAYDKTQLRLFHSIKRLLGKHGENYPLIVTGYWQNTSRNIISLRIPARREDGARNGPSTKSEGRSKNDEVKSRSKRAYRRRYHRMEELGVRWENWGQATNSGCCHVTR